MTDTTTPPSGHPIEGHPERTGIDAHGAQSTMAPGIVCADCGRARTLADDYDYTPLQLVTGRPLGWFNGDHEQMCGECLTATMRGQRP